MKKKKIKEKLKSGENICSQCDRKYTIQKSEAEARQHFCCVACEWGY